MIDAPIEKVELSEERLRYRVLRHVFDRPDFGGSGLPTLPEIGTALTLRPTEVVRVANWLCRRGYLEHPSGAPEVCVTPRSIEHFQTARERRRSLRA